MKRIVSLLSLIVLCSLLVCGCGKEEIDNKDVTGTTNVKQSIVSEDFDQNGSGLLRCNQEAVAGEGIDVSLNYIVKYKNGNILELISIQSVKSNSSESLDLYENAYNNISDNYKGLEHYEGVVVRNGDSVTYTMTINYEKINIDKLLDIEGEEDNIIKNGKAKLSLWLDLAGKVGTVCEED